MSNGTSRVTLRIPPSILKALTDRAVRRAAKAGESGPVSITAAILLCIVESLNHSARSVTGSVRIDVDEADPGMRRIVTTRPRHLPPAPPAA